jgi:hypothetical protein
MGRGQGEVMKLTQRMLKERQDGEAWTARWRLTEVYRGSEA